MASTLPASTPFLFYTNVAFVLIRLIIPIVDALTGSGWIAALQRRPELSTPVTSHRRLMEGLYLHQHGIDPYDGGSVHQTPLLLPIYHLIPSYLHFIIPCLLDVGIALFLYKLAQDRQPFLDREVWKSPSLEDVLQGVNNESDKLQGANNESDKPDQNVAESADSSLRQRKATQSTERPPLSTLKSTKQLASASNPTWTLPADKKGVIEWYHQRIESEIPPRDIVQPMLVACCWLANPLTLLSCLAGTTQSWTTFCVLGAMYCAAYGRLRDAMFLLAFATLSGFYPLALVCPSIMLLCKKEPGYGTVMSATVYFLLCLGAFLGLSFTMLQSWNFLNGTLGAILFVPDLTPNMGLYWYFFIEMFDQFRTLFLFVFQMMSFVFMGPVCLKFKHDALFACYVMVCMTSILKTYPSASDVALILTLSTLFPELFRYTSLTIFMSLFLVASFSLLPLFHQLWLYSGSGNANFYYAVTLVTVVGQVGWLIDFIRAHVFRTSAQQDAEGWWRLLRLEMSIR